MELPSDPSVPPAEHTIESPPGPVPAAGADGFEASTDRLRATLDRLVERGVLNRSQAGAVLAEIAAPSPPPRPGGLGRLLGEIAGYLGASFVVGATLLFLSEEWDVLGRTGRFWTLALMAVILSGSGLAIRLRAAAPGPDRWRGQPADDISRRLASTLMTAAAAAAGFAVYEGLGRTVDGLVSTADQRQMNVAAFAGSLTGLAVVIAGYLLARSAVGQLGMASAAVLTYAMVLELAHVEAMYPFGAGLLVLGLLWAVLAWRRLVAERRFAFAIAVTLGLCGAQWVVAGGGDTTHYPGYALMALVAGLCFAAYAVIRDWVVLAGGVAGATLVVPEFLYDVTDGSLGASGVLLVAGVTLLVGSLAGLRMRRGPGPGAAQPEA